MADAFAQVAPDSTGKQIDAGTVVTAIGTVYRQRVSIGSNTTNSFAEIRNNSLQVVGAAPSSLFYPLDFTPANPVLIRNAATELTTLNVVNVSASPVFVRLYRAATLGAVTVGTTVPFWTFALAAGEQKELKPGIVPTGIVMAWTTGSTAVNDTSLSTNLSAVQAWFGFT